MPSTDIPEILDRLEDGFPADAERGRKSERAPPIDVLLATNMISVGVDVQRLGSDGRRGPAEDHRRVHPGDEPRRPRRRPGLVVHGLNWARPRDLSHYERFEHYHATFYPRSRRSRSRRSRPALDRGLTGVLASLVRLEEIRYTEHRCRRARSTGSQTREIVAAIAKRAWNVTSEHAIEDNVREISTAASISGHTRLPSLDARSATKERRTAARSGSCGNRRRGWSPLRLSTRSGTLSLPSA